MLRKMWGNKTAEEAYVVLEKPDITVTNQKDKDVQLPKLKKLDEFAKRAVVESAETLGGCISLVSRMCVLCPRVRVSL